jgi:hypothetical protein
VNIVDYDCSDILKFKWNTSNSIPKTYIGNLFHLSGYLFEKEMVLFSGDLWEGVAVSIDLTSHGALLGFGMSLPVVIILRFHAYKIL